MSPSAIVASLCHTLFLVNIVYTVSVTSVSYQTLRPKQNFTMLRLKVINNR